MGTLLRDGAISDPFFETFNNSEWNACIGRQGDESNYVEGYLYSAQLLVDTLIEQNLFGSRDTLAMPILYNARHGLELALKYILRELTDIGMANKREGPIDHNIMNYWDHLNAQGIGDKGCRDLLLELKPFIESFTRQDIDGQELRYFENQDGKQSLEQLAVVNLLLIQAGVSELRDIIDRFLHRVARLRQESAAGTRTSECSRTDLMEIARIVGAKSKWSKPSFNKRKATAREQFGLTNNGFSRALNSIKGSRELNVIIGVDTELVYLSPDKIEEIGSLWLRANPPPAAGAQSRVIDVTKVSFHEIMRYGEAKGKFYKSALDKLSLEEFADLQTIFYIGRDGLFGEQYPELLNQTLTAHRRQKERMALVQHILSKKNFIDAMVAGLHKVGQPKMAAKLTEMRERDTGIPGS